MKELPILFSGDMVRAILDGRKTQTRRVVKDRFLDLSSVPDTCMSGFRKMDGEFAVFELQDTVDSSSPYRVRCPFGVPGDRLWVRETWKCVGDVREAARYLIYRADNTSIMVQGGVHTDVYTEECHELDAKWRPSIHMPRWACRLTLMVTDVRVERVQDITEGDAIAEGFDLATCESVFNKAAGKHTPLDCCWLTDKDGEEYGDGGYWCVECADKLAAQHDLRIDGNWGSAHESDGPATCDECYAPLMMSLSEYGIDREIFLEDPLEDNRQHFAAEDTGAAIASLIAGGIGDLQDRHKGRIAQIGFATYLDSIAKPGFKFEDNPWAWVVAFTPEPKR